METELSTPPMAMQIVFFIFFIFCVMISLLAIWYGDKTRRALGAISLVFTALAPVLRLFA